MKKYQFIVAILLLHQGLVFAQNDSATEIIPSKIMIEEMLAVPNADPQEMLSHFQKVLAEFNRTVYDSQEEQRTDYEKIVRFSIDLADRIILKNPTEDEKRIALGIKYRSLLHLAQKEEANKKTLFDFAKMLSTMDELGSLAQVAKLLPYNWEMDELIKSSDFVNDAKAFRKKLIDFVQANPNDLSILLLLDFLDLIDLFAPEKEAFPLIKESAVLFRPLLKNGDPRLAISFEEIVKKADFYGNFFDKEFKLEGIDLNGKPFNVQSLKGKVVLISFWATWCPPCLVEIPNMKNVYEKYKEKGFEIVGYSIDSSVDALKVFVERDKSPWISLSRRLSIEAKLEDFSKTYNITDVPAVFLLDKEGKLVSMRAQGEELEKILEKLLGESESK